jgi:C-terminal processing protease CtpA/Prc
MNIKKLSRSILPAAVLAALGLALAGSISAGDKACDISSTPCLVGLVEKLKGRGWVGIETDVKEGVPEVKRVMPDSPAEKAGLAKGDLLREVNGVPYRKDNMAALDKIYQMMVPNQTLTYTIERQGKTLQVPVKLARVPEQLMAQWIGQHVLEAYEMLHARKGDGGR